MSRFVGIQESNYTGTLSPTDKSYFVIFAPAGYNPEGVSILESEIGVKTIQEIAFMSGKELPILQHLS